MVDSRRKEEFFKLFSLELVDGYVVVCKVYDVVLDGLKKVIMGKW